MTDFEGLWAVVVLETYSIGECNVYLIRNINPK